MFALFLMRRGDNLRRNKVRRDRNSDRQQVKHKPNARDGFFAMMILRRMPERRLSISRDEFVHGSSPLILKGYHPLTHVMVS